MKTKSIVLLVLALGCGLVASIGISQVIERNKQGTTTAVETDNIIVAAKPIDGQTQLKAEHYKLEAWPKNLIPKGAFTRPEDVEGERVRYALAPGEPILATKLVGEGDGNASGNVPEGYRLIAVPADAVNAVGHLIKPNDRVDLLVYLKQGFMGNSGASGTKTILQDIKVFAVNDQWRQSEDKSAESVSVKNVTLLVTPEQAEVVTLASELGKVKIILRSPDDKLKSEPTDGTSPSDLLGVKDSASTRDEELSGLKKKNGLLDLLGASEKPAAIEPIVLAPAPPPEEHFTMELLEGPATRKVEFSKADGPSTKWRSDGSAASASPSPGTAGVGQQAAAVLDGLSTAAPATDGLDK